MGVGYLNDCTAFSAACEGDTDSAVTMLIMRHLTSDKLWMANPLLMPDGSVLFSHCTAPLTVKGRLCRTVLRSHHETGVGVSPQVFLPENIRVTLCRVSAATGQMTVAGGTSVKFEEEPVCRTQLAVMPDNPDKFLDSLLGCHQVIAFEDIERKLRLLGELCGLDVL